MLTVEIIVLLNRRRVQRSIHLGQLRIGLVAVFFLTSVGAAYWFGMGSAPRVSVVQVDPTPYVLSLQKKLQFHEKQVSVAVDRAKHNMDALALRLSELKARSIRLDALGERLVQLEGLDSAEFNFSEPPPQGGKQAGSFPVENPAIHQQAADHHAVAAKELGG